MSELTTWVVIPTYNERASLPPLLARLFAVGSWRVLVVDDNSPDGTGQVAEDLRGDYPLLAVLHRPGKQGLGPAYRDGLRQALDQGAEVVIHCDADGSHPPELIPRLLASLDQNDLAIASRYVAGGKIAIDWRRRWISQIGNVYIRSMLGWQIRDWSTGFKAWRAETLGKVLAAPLEATGYACLMEMTWWAQKMGGRVVEVPLDFVDRAAGQSKFTLGIVVEDIRLAWRLRWRR